MLAFRGKKADELQAMADSVPLWWHSIDLGKGVVTPGVKPLRHLEAELATLRLPPLKRKTVLDVGAWDGFFSFQMERLGASRVVALDSYVWSMDLVAKQEYWRRCQQTGEEPREYHVVPGVWQPERMPGKAGFDVAREALGSQVEAVVADFMTVDLDRLGSFDVVLFKGVFYHLRHPLVALERLARVTREVAVVETSAIVVRGLEDHALCEFFESDQLNADPTNWWAPNLLGLHGLCRAAGFARVETVAGPPEEAAFADSAVFRYRAVVHAYK